MSADRDNVTFVIGDAEVRLPADDVAALEAFLMDHAPHHERRVGFRVPVARLQPETLELFRVHVYANERMLAAQPVDLSLTGILLETNDEIADGEAVRITLVLGKYRCRLAAQVVRRHADHCALHFVDTVKDDTLDPPEELITIFRLLEQSFLKTRGDTAGVALR